MFWRVDWKSMDGWEYHSTHDSYRDAVDQADMIHGRVVGDTGISDLQAWRWAVLNQGFEGDFAAWQAQNDKDRDAYEQGARGSL